MISRIKKIISFRYTAQELLNEPFFAEVTGVRVEVALKPDDDTPGEQEQGEEKSRTVSLRLIVEDAQKLKQKHKNDDAVEFDFDINKDIPIEIAKDLVRISLRSGRH